MRLLIYPFYLIWTIISTNIVKSIILTVIATLFYCAYFTSAYNDEVVRHKIVYSMKIDNTYYYLFNPDKDGNFKSLQSDKALTFKNNTYEYKTTSEAFSILIILAYFILIIFIICLVVAYGQNDDGILWEFNDCFKEAFNILIICELEDGYYHYFVLGRLVGKSQEPLRYYNADSFASLLRCPKFKTKRQRRNEVLNKLF